MEHRVRTTLCLIRFHIGLITGSGERSHSVPTLQTFSKPATDCRIYSEIHSIAESYGPTGAEALLLHFHGGAVQLPLRFLWGQILWLWLGLVFWGAAGLCGCQCDWFFAVCFSRSVLFHCPWWVKDMEWVTVINSSVHLRQRGCEKTSRDTSQGQVLLGRYNWGRAPTPSVLVQIGTNLYVTPLGGDNPFSFFILDLFLLTYRRP